MRRIYISNVVIVVLMVLVVGCGSNGASLSVKELNHNVAATDQPPKYTPPHIPALLSSQQERIDYLAQNYWNNFDFRDTTTISSKFMEEAFAKYIYCLNSVSSQMMNKSVTSLLDSASVDSVMFENFIDISEKYLYDPNSPMRNEELYIPFLQYILESPLIDKWNKLRPKHQLDMALKNRVGEIATDFVITERDGRQSRLSQHIGSGYTMLLFNNPDCQDCKRVKEFIISNANIFSKITIVSLYPDADIDLWLASDYPPKWVNGYDKDQILNRDELYDLKAIPTVYLLDNERRVVLKDATIENVARYLAIKNT